QSQRRRSPRSRRRQPSHLASGTPTDRDANAKSRVRPWRSPVTWPPRGNSRCALPVGKPPLTTAQFAKSVKFSYLGADQSISYDGGCDGKPIFAGIDDPPAARAGRRSEKSVGHGGGQTTPSHAAGRDVA